MSPVKVLLPLAFTYYAQIFTNESFFTKKLSNTCEVRYNPSKSDKVRILIILTAINNFSTKNPKCSEVGYLNIHVLANLHLLNHNYFLWTIVHTGPQINCFAENRPLYHFWYSFTWRIKIRSESSFRSPKSLQADVSVEVLP